jgi:hypothetical protein
MLIRVRSLVCDLGSQAGSPGAKDRHIGFDPFHEIPPVFYGLMSSVEFVISQERLQMGYRITIFVG